MARLGRVGQGVFQDPVEHWKIVTIGVGGVGKSSFIFQFVDSVFVDDYDPTIEDCFRKNVNVQGTVCALEILDTAGQSCFSTTRDYNIFPGQGFLIMYSITSKDSFEAMEGIFEQVRRVKDADYYPWVLIGNKCDLEKERIVSSEDGESLAKKNGAPFFETSAKDRTNVYEAVEELVEMIRSHQRENSVPKRKTKKGCIIL